MALVASYVAKPTQISFHHSLISDWIRIENVIHSGPGDVDVEGRAGVPQWDIVARN